LCQSIAGEATIHCHAAPCRLSQHVARIAAKQDLATLHLGVLGEHVSGLLSVESAESPVAVLVFKFYVKHVFTFCSSVVVMLLLYTIYRHLSRGFSSYSELFPELFCKPRKHTRRVKPSMMGEASQRISCFYRRSNICDRILFFLSCPYYTYFSGFVNPCTPIF
jgi:hypothetical protein